MIINKKINKVIFVKEKKTKKITSSSSWRILAKACGWRETKDKVKESVWALKLQKWDKRRKSENRVKKGKKGKEERKPGKREEAEKRVD